jgi:hypothetical protein
MAQFSAYIAETELFTRRRFRASIFHAWDYQCAYCGDHADTLDHVVPRADGGATVVENLVPACRRCNLAKSDADWLDWFQQQRGCSADRVARIDGWLRPSAEAA